MTLEWLGGRLAIITQSLRWALWAHALWFAKMNDTDLLGRLGASQAIHPVGRATSILHQGAVLALMRVWDAKKKTGSLPALARDLRQAAGDAGFFQKMVVDRGEAAAQSFMRDAVAYAIRIEEECKSPERRGLKQLRDETLAHSRYDDPEGDDSAAFGDERRLLERTVPLVDQLSEFIDGPRPGYAVSLVKENMTIKAISPLLWAGVRRETEDELLAYQTRVYDLEHPEEKIVGADQRRQQGGGTAPGPGPAQDYRQGGEADDQVV
ncbi:AbiU2 domain-containing protein [Aliihoeflea sp.]|uniref:AbiU2 domain-containing protein n=1 Tax=Aliihoeflea sp. TaxID=2608088 RepID=UPI00403385EC